MNLEFLDKIQNKLEGRKINSIEDIEQSQSFCMMPWVHIYISQFGKVTPCCVSPWDGESILGNVNDAPIKDIWNGKPMKNIRKKMLKDKKIEGCKQCYENDDCGTKSHRKTANFRYIHHYDWVKKTKNNGLSLESKPIYWDIRISNFCNLKCRICGHHSSSKWYDEAKQLGELNFEKRLNYSMDDFGDILEQLEEFAPYVEEITFLGGEPVLMKEQHQIVELLKKHQNFDVQMRYVTNFTKLTLEGKSVIDLWSGFNDVNVHASLDGMDERGEYQRKGQVWSEVVENRLTLMKKAPHVQFMINPCISVFNIFHLLDFHKKWVEEGLVIPERFLPDSLKSPNEYCIKILPKHLKKQVEINFLEHIEWLKTCDVVHHELMDIVINEFRNTITFMNSEDWSNLIPKFVERNNKLDGFRKESTLEIFPELADLYKIAEKKN